MWRVRLSAAAEQDFKDIIHWTAEHFGRAQARRYTQVITTAIAALRDGPAVRGSRLRDDLGDGLRIMPAGRRSAHFVIYRATGDRLIEVVRILHQSMDLARHVDR